MKEVPFTIREFKSVVEDSRLFNDAMAYHFMEMKEIEKNNFTLFTDLILRNLDDNEDIGGLYFDTDIKVTPDFDCLFFSEEGIVNIDLKDIHNEKTEEKVIKKFKVQNRILSLTKKAYLNLVFFADEKRLYLFKSENNTLEECPIAKFSKCMANTHAISTNLIYSLKPSDYIISPTENIEGFLKGEYYLNEQQRRVEEIVMAKSGMYGVNGEAGTGKTLIAFDLAKKFKNLDKKVLFIFSGNLHEGHKTLAEELNITIIPAKQCTMMDLDEFDLIIVDEAQKLYSSSRVWLYNWGRINNEKNLVFFYHVKQTLSSKDSGQLILNLCKTIEKDGMGRNLCLSKKIRSNPAITAFANNLFDLNNKPSPKRFSLDDFLNCVDIKYFSSAKIAKPWIRELVKKGYKFLIPAGDRMREASSDKFRYDFEEFFDTHNIIGEERDKVVTYIDECVAYNKGKLKKNSKEYYFIDNEIYVNLTRAKEKLAIAIIGNFDVYEAITEVILNPEKWNKNS